MHPAYSQQMFDKIAPSCVFVCVFKGLQANGKSKCIKYISRYEWRANKRYE